MFKAGRRNFVKLVALLFGSTIIPKINADSSVISFQGFYDFSKTITGFNELNVKYTRNVYDLIISEPWGKENLKNIISKISQLELTASSNQKTIFKADNFDEGEQWFISHLLLTFYTGVFFHETGNKNISLKDSLMHQLQIDYRQPPTYCSGEIGFWAEPPKL